jgi:hypothetical protein
MKETKLNVLDEAGNRVWRGRCATEPACLDARQAKKVPDMKVNKTDANDAEGLAYLVRTGSSGVGPCFGQSVHFPNICRSLSIKRARMACSKPMSAHFRMTHLPQVARNSELVCVGLRFSPGLIKIDVEGLEFDVLKSETSLFSKRTRLRMKNFVSNGYSCDATIAT